MSKYKRNDSNTRVIKVPYFLSESDVMLLDEWYDGVEDKEPGKFARILWDNGMNIVDYPVEEQMNTHRNLRNQVVTCRRWYSGERTDSDWAKKGAMSFEAMIASTTDRSFQDDLIRMSRRSKSAEVDRVDIIPELVDD